MPVVRWWGFFHRAKMVSPRFSLFPTIFISIAYILCLLVLQPQSQRQRKPTLILINSYLDFNPISFFFYGHIQSLKFCPNWFSVPRRRYLSRISSQFSAHKNEINSLFMWLCAFAYACVCVCECFDVISVSKSANRNLLPATFYFHPIPIAIWLMIYLHGNLHRTQQTFHNFKQMEFDFKRTWRILYNKMCNFTYKKFFFREF